MLPLVLRDGPGVQSFEEQNIFDIVSTYKLKSTAIIYLILALNPHLNRMSITDIVVLYLTKSQEYTQLMYNAEFYQLKVVKRFTSDRTPGYNGKCKIFS